MTRPPRAADGERWRSMGVPVCAMHHPDMIQKAEVALFDSGYFEFAVTGKAPGEPRTQYVLPVRDETGAVVDLCAFGFSTRCPWRWNGRGVCLGGENIADADPLNPLRVHASVFAWLADHRRGVVILDHARAASLLADVDLEVADGRQRAELARLLTRRPSIRVESGR